MDIGKIQEKISQKLIQVSKCSTEKQVWPKNIVSIINNRIIKRMKKIKYKEGDKINQKVIYNVKKI